MAFVFRSLWAVGADLIEQCGMAQLLRHPDSHDPRHRRPAVVANEFEKTSVSMRILIRGERANARELDMEEIAFQKRFEQSQ